MTVKIDYFRIDKILVCPSQCNIVMKGRELSGWVILFNSRAINIFTVGIKVGTLIRVSGTPPGPAPGLKGVHWNKYIMKMKIVPAHVYNFPDNPIRKINFVFEVSDTPPEKWGTQELINIAGDCLQDAV